MHKFQWMDKIIVVAESAVTNTSKELAQATLADRGNVHTIFVDVPKFQRQVRGIVGCHADMPCS